MEHKKNSKKKWFKAEMYGWGWYPVSWEGWIIISLYMIAISLHFINIEKFAHSTSDALLNFSIPFVITTVFLLIICYARGERPSFRLRR